MVKVKGVNIYPSQIDMLLATIEGASSEYQLVVDRKEGKDAIMLRVEKQDSAGAAALADTIRKQVKTKIGLLMDVEVLEEGGLPRSEKKTPRVLDYRQS